MFIFRHLFFLQVEQKKMIFGIVTRIDLLNFIKENDEDASSENGDAFRPGRVGSTASLTHKIEALKMNSAASASASAAASMGNGDAASHFQLVNGNVNGHVNGEINGDHAR